MIPHCRPAPLFALTIAVALLGVATASAATPDAVRGLPSGFDPQAAIESVYEGLQTRDGAILWTSPAYSDEPSRVSVLGVLPFKQGGDERLFLITQLVPAEGDFRCHACSPGIGVAAFTKTPAGWTLDVGTPYVTDIGSYGSAPEPDLARVGSERYALAFDVAGVAQGYHGRATHFLLETATGVGEALWLQTYEDNSGACDPEYDKDIPEEEREGRPGHRCFAYTSKLDFVPGASEDYFDLTVTKTGPDEGRFSEKAVYAVRDGKYELTSRQTVDYRMVPHPETGVELPRIAVVERPEVEKAVNDSLESLAADMKCDADAPEGSEYEAWSEVTYADHDVLSVSIHATAFCGGAHPMLGANFSRTFDLQTGRSIGFRELFDDFERDRLKIADAYLASLDPDAFEGCEDVLTTEVPEGAIAEAAETTFDMYGFGYTVSADGLVLQPEFPHVIRACANSSTVPFAALRELAAAESLLTRIADANR